MKENHILGLDLGTNSIGWAVIKEIINDDETKELKGILGAGSRIIPMDAATLSDFAKGNSVSQTSERTRLRGARRLIERSKLRRERLHRVLMIMDCLPSHYAKSLTRYGKFKANTEVRLPWTTDEAGNAFFLFQDAYDEMLHLFWEAQPELMKNGQRVPYDWTLYYLRKKALTELLSDYELSWVLLSFNQKRGYYQTRAEDKDIEEDKRVEYLASKVINIEDTGEKRGKERWFNIHLENGMVYRRTFADAPNWIGKTKEFVVTTHLNADGTEKVDKNGEVKRSFRLPKEEDWTLIKVKTQADIDKSRLTIGEYIFNSLLTNPKQKIRGELVQTIERDYYRNELEQIMNKQCELNPKLQDTNLYAECIEELYHSNIELRNSIARRGFKYLFIDNIIFYHRPLKSQKRLIDECKYEYHECIIDNEVQKKYIKCIAKSHPLYQEFRLWQFVSNLRIYSTQRDDKGRLIDIDITPNLLPNATKYTELFNKLNNLKQISLKSLLKLLDIKATATWKEELPYKWNYVQDKEYPCNTTRGEIIERLNKKKIAYNFLNRDNEERLWHILYSVTDRSELRKALTRFANNIFINDKATQEAFTEVMAKFPPFESAYGAYSAKALKRLLPLMRMGEYWSEEDIDNATRSRIQKIIDGEVDDSISTRVREKAISLTNISDFCGLPSWLATYVVYNKHSESSNTDRWRSPDDIDNYLSQFKQHSLRNPIVEQVVTETLRTVRDIWREYGHIDEIHVELGREMKNPADKRKEMTRRIMENENANLRAKALLTAFMNPELEIENVRPYSPNQLELFRIYEESILNSVDEIEDDIQEILNKFSDTDVKHRPTPSEIYRYRLWLEQKYLSPYTGQPIPLSRLFTSDYEIEHIIPRSRYFDDSYSNKVICESEVNKKKNNMLAFEFIQKFANESIPLGGGRTVRIFDVGSYQQHIERTYKRNSTKMKKLLLDDIPTDFIERQLNDSRYISKFVKALLSNIVREDGEQEATAKKLIVCTGAVTDRLKHDWGVDNVWNHIVLPRFERMNKITNSTRFTTRNTQGHLIPAIPPELQRGFNKKRIDHRHHAMDAIVIACATRDHVNLLNNEAALPRNNANRYALSYKLRKLVDETENNNDGTTTTRKVFKEFKKPWDTFPNDIENTLKQIVVSFKSNQRIINKTTNYTTIFVDGEKRIVPQTKGDRWAIRKPMHKDTVFGEVNLCKEGYFKLAFAIQKPERIIDVQLRNKIEELIKIGYNERLIKEYFRSHNNVWGDVNPNRIKMRYYTKESNDHYYATRTAIDGSFNESKILQITDTGIQRIMLNHLAHYNGNAQMAFSPDGVEQMNLNIVELNGGSHHQPIYKVRLCERANKYAVGVTGNKNKKFVEGAKGTNLFFAIYEEKKINKRTQETITKRTFRTFSLNEAIEKHKAGRPIDEEALFVLSPNDLVYVPTVEELRTGKVSMPINRDRIYKMVSSSSYQCFFVKETVSSPIQDQKEFSSMNKMERAITDEMIKDICVPLTVNRLGKIIKVGI